MHNHILSYLISGTKQNGTYIILLKIHHYGTYAIVKLYQLIGLGILESVDADHTVTHLEHGANLLETGRCIYALKLLQKYLRYLTCLYSVCHYMIRLFFSISSLRIRCNCQATLASKRYPSTISTNPPSRAGSTVCPPLLLLTLWLFI